MVVPHSKSSAHCWCNLLRLCKHQPEVHEQLPPLVQLKEKRIFTYLQQKLRFKKQMVVAGQTFISDLNIYLNFYEVFFFEFLHNEF